MDVIALNADRINSLRTPRNKKFGEIPSMIRNWYISESVVSSPAVMFVPSVREFQGIPACSNAVTFAKSFDLAAWWSRFSPSSFTDQSSFDSVSSTANI